VVLEAVFVNAVTTLHEDNRLGRAEHVIATDGAVTVNGPLNTLVFARHGDTCHAFLAMEEILSQPLTNSAQPTVVAVINGLIRVVVPQLADATIVVPRGPVASYTGI